MEETYMAGYLAYKQGQDVETNPHDEGTDEYVDWEAGWRQAAAEADRNNYWSRS